MTYLINTWYVEDKEGNIYPVANLGTARYLVKTKEAVRMIDPTREMVAK